MPAHRRTIQPIFQPMPVNPDDLIKRLAHASALLAKGQARRMQAAPASRNTLHVKVVSSDEDQVKHSHDT